MLLLSLAPYSHSMSTFSDLGPNRTNEGRNYISPVIAHLEVCVKGLPVVGDIEVKVADVRCVFRQNNVASELPRGEPEGKIGNVVELEFCMNPAAGRIRSRCNLIKVCFQPICHKVCIPNTTADHFPNKMFQMFQRSPGL